MEIVQKVVQLLRPKKESTTEEKERDGKEGTKNKMRYETMLILQHKPGHIHFEM